MAKSTTCKGTPLRQKMVTTILFSLLTCQTPSLLSRMRATFLSLRLSKHQQRGHVSGSGGIGGGGPGGRGPRAPWRRATHLTAKGHAPRTMHWQRQTGLAVVAAQIRGGSGMLKAVLAADPVSTTLSGNGAHTGQHLCQTQLACPLQQWCTHGAPSDGSGYVDLVVCGQIHRVAVVR